MNCSEGIIQIIATTNFIQASTSSILHSSSHAPIFLNLLFNCSLGSIQSACPILPPFFIITSFLFSLQFLILPPSSHFCHVLQFLSTPSPPFLFSVPEEAVICLFLLPVCFFSHCLSSLLAFHPLSISSISC